MSNYSDAIAKETQELSDSGYIVYDEDGYYSASPFVEAVLEYRIAVAYLKADAPRFLIDRRIEIAKSALKQARVDREYPDTRGKLCAGCSGRYNMYEGFDYHPAKCNFYHECPNCGTRRVIRGTDAGTVQIPSKISRVLRDGK